MTHIAIVSAHLLAQSGYGRQARELALRIADLGYEVYAIGGFGHQTIYGMNVTLTTPRGNVVKCLNTFGDPAGSTVFPKYNKMFKFDIVISLWDYPLTTYLNSQNVLWIAMGPIDACVPGDTLIIMADGSLKPIREIKVGDYVLGYKNGKLVHAKVLAKFERYVDVIYEIRTRSRTLRITEEHPVFVKGRWIPVKYLNVGDRLLVVATKTRVKIGATNLSSLDRGRRGNVKEIIERREESKRDSKNSWENSNLCEEENTEIESAKEKERNKEMDKRRVGTLEETQIQIYKKGASENIWCGRMDYKEKTPITRYNNIETRERNIPYGGGSKEFKEGGNSLYSVICGWGGRNINKSRCSERTRESLPNTSNWSIQHIQGTYRVDMEKTREDGVLHGSKIQSREEETNISSTHIWMEMSTTSKDPPTVSSYKEETCRTINKVHRKISSTLREWLYEGGNRNSRTNKSFELTEETIQSIRIVGKGHYTKVFNLETETQNYFANGILVHNCLTKHWAKMVEGAYKIVAYSKYAYRELLKYYPPSKVEYIPHAINTEVFKPRHEARSKVREKLQVPEDAFLLINVSDNVPRKQLGFLLWCFKKFLEKHPAEPIFLYLHTNWSVGYPRGLNIPELIRELNLGDKVKLPTLDPMINPIEDLEMSYIYSACDVMIHTSLAEGFGLPLVEAMACGVPVIAVNSSSMTELVEPTSGWLIETIKDYIYFPCYVPTLQYHFPPSIKSTLQRLEEAYEAWRTGEIEELRRKCVKFAKQYDWNNVFPRWERLLKEVEEELEIMRGVLK